MFNRIITIFVDVYDGLHIILEHPWYYILIWCIICGFVQRAGIGGGLRKVIEWKLNRLKN